MEGQENRNTDPAGEQDRKIARAGEQEEWKGGKTGILIQQENRTGRVQGQ